MVHSAVKFETLTIESGPKVESELHIRLCNDILLKNLRLVLYKVTVVQLGILTSVSVEVQASSYY